ILQAGIFQIILPPIRGGGFQMNKFLIGVMAAVAMTFAVAQSASAAIVFDISFGNPGLAGYTGPYAQVTIDLTSSTTANISFASLTNGGNVYLLGSNGAAAVNVNAATWT